MNASATILDFTNSVFISRRQIKKGAAMNYRVAVRRFGKMLGRDAKLSDLTTDNIAKFKQHLSDSGLKSSSPMVNIVLAIWSMAYYERLTDTTADVGTYRGLKFFRQVHADKPAGHLMAEIVARSDKAKDTIERMRWAVSWLAEVIGRPVSCGDMRAEVVEGFLEQVKTAAPKSLKRITRSIRSAWWVAHRAGLSESPGRIRGVWDDLATMIEKAPPIVIDKIPESSKTLLLSDFLANQYYPCLPGIADTTKKEYATSVAKLEQYLGRAAVLSDLNNQTVGMFLGALIQLEQRASTIAKDRAQLLAFWRHACRLGLLVVGPLIQTMTQPERIPTALSIEQLKQLRRAIPLITGDIGGIPKACLLRAVFSIQYVTAARLGAVLDLTFADVTGNVITFRAETRKGRRKPMVKAVPTWVVDDIKAISKPKRDRLFPVDNGVVVFADIFDRLFTLADVPRPKGKSSHLLRSTHATMVDQAGGDATASLGHTKEETTRRSYLDPRHSPDASCELLPKLGGANHAS